MTAGLEQIVEADDVRLDISSRIGNGIAHPSLRGQIHYNRRTVAREKIVNQLFIGNGAFDESPSSSSFLRLWRHFFDFAEALVFDIDIIIVGDAVDAYYAYVTDFIEQSFDKIAANKAGSPGH